MPRRVSTSQLRSRLRQVEAKRRQAVQRHNNEVRRYNSERKRQIDAYNRAVRSYNSERKRRVDTYNRAVRSYNNRLRSNHHRLQSALQRLARQPATVQFASLRQSSLSLSTAYQQLDSGSADPFLSDLAERETANSVSVINVLLGDDEHTQDNVDDLATSGIIDSLSNFSEDLAMRWSGAIFALNPANPDAARHFCTSAREIIAGILDMEAPNEDVLAEFPDCQVTERGTPTRRAKVHYCLDRSGLANVFLEGFVEANIKDLSTLFSDLNSGAHGSAGKFTLEQLATVKSRVEDAIDFICEIVS